MIKNKVLTDEVNSPKTNRNWTRLQRKQEWFRIWWFSNDSLVSNRWTIENPKKTRGKIVRTIQRDSPKSISGEKVIFEDIPA